MSRKGTAPSRPSGRSSRTTPACSTTYSRFEPSSARAMSTGALIPETIVRSATGPGAAPAESAVPSASAASIRIGSMRGILRWLWRTGTPFVGRRRRSSPGLSGQETASVFGAGEEAVDERLARIAGGLVAHPEIEAAGVRGAPQHAGIHHRDVDLVGAARLVLGGFGKPGHHLAARLRAPIQLAHPEGEAARVRRTPQHVVVDERDELRVVQRAVA